MFGNLFTRAAGSHVQGLPSGHRAAGTRSRRTTHPRRGTGLPRRPPRTTRPLERYFLVTTLHAQTERRAPSSRPHMPDRPHGASAADRIWAVVGTGGLPTVPTLSVQGAAHHLRRRPRAAALDPEPSSARRLAEAGGHGLPRQTATSMDDHIRNPLLSATSLSMPLSWNCCQKMPEMTAQTAV